MARLQVLYLPSASDGDRHDARYALVVDQAAELDLADREALSAFAATAGGQGCVVLSGTVDLAQDDGDDETRQALGELLRDALATPQFEAAAQPQKPKKLPPANTTEGKLARIWQRPNPTDGDPQ